MYVPQPVPCHPSALFAQFFHVQNVENVEDAWDGGEISPFFRGLLEGPFCFRGWRN